MTKIGGEGLCEFDTANIRDTLPIIWVFFFPRFFNIFLGRRGGGVELRWGVSFNVRAVWISGV